jgi:hypothetical protein
MTEAFRTGLLRHVRDAVAGGHPPFALVPDQGQAVAESTPTPFPMEGQWGKWYWKCRKGRHPAGEYYIAWCAKTLVLGDGPPKDPSVYITWQDTPQEAIAALRREVCP